MSEQEVPEKEEKNEDFVKEVFGEEYFVQQSGQGVTCISPLPPPQAMRAPVSIGPEELEEIGKMYTTGSTMRTIAKRFGTDVATIHRHIVQDLRPKWEERLNAHLADECAKLDEAEEIAWADYKAGKPNSWNAVQAIMKHRASLAGLWAPKKAEIRHQDETIRIVGIDKDELRKRLLAELGPADDVIDVPSRPALPRPHEMEGLDVLESE